MIKTLFRIVTITGLAMVALLLFNCSGDAHPQDVKQVPNPKETDGGYVSNPDGILSESVVQQINDQLALLDHSGKAQVAVVLLNSIGSHVPKDFAVELFNFWKIGSKEKDNGLLILLVKDQHRVEFETGYGIEDVLPDIICFRIQQDYMVPYFQSADFETGMLQGVNALVTHFDEGNAPVGIAAAVDPSLQPIPPDNYEIAWEDNVYTFKQNRKISLLKAWSIIRRENEFLNLPEIPDTSISFFEKTPDGYTYTFQIPHEFSFENGLEVFLNSFVFLVFNAIMTAIALFASFGGGDRRKYNQNEPRRFLFSNKIFFSRWLAFLFLLAVPIVLLQVYLFLFKSIDAPGYVSLAIGYLTWCAYVHLHYLVLIPANVPKLTDRHSKYEALSEAYRNLRRLTFIFPFPFLWLFYIGHRARVRKLRESPVNCECGAQMVKLNEIQDNEFISSGDLREEELNSMDYDVWVCNSCSRHQTFQYENFQSSAMRCKSCSKKTVKMEQREVVKESTTSSSGYGYNHYLCKNCNEKSKIKFVIPKKSSSSSSGSDSSSSGSGSSSSWGGGSSGGGGAGSSW